MNKVYILYRSFFDMKGKEHTVGGIQTYIRQLIEVIKKNNSIPIIVQFADCNFHKKFKEVDVFGVDVKNVSKTSEKSNVLIEYVKKDFNHNDVLLFASDDIFVPSFTDRVITIQHGITWDKPLSKKKFLTLEFLKKNINSYKRLRRLKKLKTLICVDHNFVNWYRTQVCLVDKNLYVIPNSTKIKKKSLLLKNNNKIKIIFARRFQIYRGTRLFAITIKRILDKYENISVTFAGTGPDEGYLKNMFSDYSNVNFITYKSEESLNIHEEFDIAVVPTLGSEGTSLSLIEAMASKCAVVATNVGGITNIILDNYNGLLVNPTEKQFYEALEKLVVDEQFRKNISENAYQTVLHAFNIDLWEEKWLKVFKNINKE
jgi:glycosyltransferase involved in cell wall biosynthesis